MRDALLVLLLSLAPASCSSPTGNPHRTDTYYAPTLAALLRRDECPVDTFRCPASLGAAFSDICCQNGQTCDFDSRQNPACCPSGAVCTGTAPATATGSSPTIAASYVPNSYFSFPYAQTTYDDSASCAAATSACSHNYDACVTGLEGDNGYQVTIFVPSGGGVTVDNSAANLGASATSVCSSLSSQACSHLDAVDCKSFGSGSRTSQTYIPSWILLLLTAGGGIAINLPDIWS